MCFLPWGRHHRSLPFHQGVQEGPEDKRNEWTVILSGKKIIMLQAHGAAAWISSSVFNDFNLLTVLSTAVPAWDLIWDLIWLLEYIIMLHWNIRYSISVGSWICVLTAAWSWSMKCFKCKCAKKQVEDRDLQKLSSGWAEQRHRTLRFSSIAKSCVEMFNLALATGPSGEQLRAVQHQISPCLCNRRFNHPYNYSDERGDDFILHTPFVLPFAARDSFIFTPKCRRTEDPAHWCRLNVRCGQDLIRVFDPWHF